MTARPIPGPHLRHIPQCTRYSREGVKCENRTDRRDGWCGSCDGFCTAQRKPYDPELINHSFLKWNNVPMPPLSSDEAYEIDVTRNAVNVFARFHPGTSAQHAEHQIRTMLEDFITNGRCRSGSGSKDGGKRYLLEHASSAFRGYHLLLGPDLASVISYQTTHAERTYGQVRAGIASRPDPDAEHLRELQRGSLKDRFDRLGVTVSISLRALSEWASLAHPELPKRLTAWPDEAILKVYGHVAENVMPKVPVDFGDSDSFIVTDQLGWNWMVCEGDRPGERFIRKMWETAASEGESSPAP